MNGKLLSEEINRIIEFVSLAKNKQEALETINKRIKVL
jgi:hypothetical protein